MRRLAKPALIAIFFAAAFGLATAVIDRLLPFPEVRDVTVKLDHLDAHGNEYDAIFVGSSRVFYHVMPSVFDPILTERGHSLKSFNAGISGMFAPEDSYFLDEVLRRPHGRLRWVFVEVERVENVIKANLRNTPRLPYWHDSTRLAVVTKAFFRQNPDAEAGGGKRLRFVIRRLTRFDQSLADWLTHLRLFCERACHLGRCAGLASRLGIPSSSDPTRKPMGRDGDGWGFNETREKMPPDVEIKYSRDLAERLRNPAPRVPGDHVSDGALEMMAARITAAGAVPVFIVSPNLKPDYQPSPKLKERYITLDFSDVRQYPDIFEADLRFDDAHLNAAGAEAYTRHLAKRFAEVLDAKR